MMTLDQARTEAVLYGVPRLLVSLVMGFQPRVIAFLQIALESVRGPALALSCHQRCAVGVGLSKPSSSLGARLVQGHHSNPA